MSLTELFSISGAILIRFLGGATIVFAISKWLGGVWAGRILESEKAALVREQELLIRRINGYSKLALAMRVFLSSLTPATYAQKDAFLGAYDEAALWASEDVIAQVSKFLDILIESGGNASQEAMKEAYIRCITVMRRDCGFPKSEYSHRVVTFST